MTETRRVGGYPKMGETVTVGKEDNIFELIKDYMIKENVDTTTVESLTITGLTIITKGQTSISINNGLPVKMMSFNSDNTLYFVSFDNLSIQGKYGSIEVMNDGVEIDTISFYYL